VLARQVCNGRCTPALIICRRFGLRGVLPWSFGPCSFPLEVRRGSSRKARELLDFSVARCVPIGNGIITVDSDAQALMRARVNEADKGGDVAVPRSRSSRSTAASTGAEPQVSTQPESAASGAIAFGPYQLFPTQQLLLEGEKPLRLGSRVIEILKVLTERAGTLVTK
jgi:hypothetical protein